MSGLKCYTKHLIDISILISHESSYELGGCLVAEF